MNEINRRLWEASDWVTALANARLPDGSTLREALTFDGISLYDAAAPDLAIYLFPEAMQGRQAHPVAHHLRCWLGPVRARLRARRNPETKPLPAPGHWLLLGFSEYMRRDVLEPFAASLKRHERGLPVTVQDTPENEGAALSVWQAWDEHAARTAADLRRMLERVRSLALAKDGLPQTARSPQGKPLWPEIGQTLQQLLINRLPTQAALVALAETWMRRAKPAAVLCPDVADPRARIFVLVAKKHGVPTIEVQFGNCGDEAVEWRFSLAHHIAAWGTASAEVMGKHGAPADRIVCTGSPRHDALLHGSAEARRLVRDALGLPADARMVLFASSVADLKYGDGKDLEALQRTQKAIVEAAAQARGWHLVYKPHPLEDPEDVQRVAEHKANVTLLGRQHDIRQLVQACDVFVSLGSTATLDAIMLGKPTLCAVLPGWIWAQNYEQSGAVVVARSESELEDAVSRLAEPATCTVLQAGLAPARQSFLQRYVHAADGRASERIAETCLAQPQKTTR